MSETIFSNSLIFQEFAKLKYKLNLKISKSQNFNRVTVLLYLTRLFVYSIIIWEGFFFFGGGGRDREQRHIFLMAYVQ